VRTPDSRLHTTRPICDVHPVCGDWHDCFGRHAWQKPGGGHRAPEDCRKADRDELGGTAYSQYLFTLPAGARGSSAGGCTADPSAHLPRAPDRRHRLTLTAHRV
jgi:hypothetical protein